MTKRKKFNYPYEQYINDLKAVPSGIKYLELVNNPKNHLKPNEEGENHHFHMQALGGENGPQVRLSYYNHTLCHIYLAEAGLEGDRIWKGAATHALNQIARKQFKLLSEIEKITIEEKTEWSELRRLGQCYAAQCSKDNWNNKNIEEKNEFRKKCSDIYWSRPEAERDEISKKRRDSLNNPDNKSKRGANISKNYHSKSNEEKERLAKEKSDRLNNLPPEKKAEWGDKISKHYNDKSDEEKKEISLKKSKSLYEYRNNVETKEQKEERINKFRITMNNKSDEEKQLRLSRMSAAYHNKSEEEKTDIQRRNSESNKKTLKGYIYMTDGTHKPMKVIKSKQPEFFEKHWYRCHKNSVIPWEEKVA